MADKHYHPVMITDSNDTQVYDDAFRTGNNAKWQECLKQARRDKATTVVTCCCIPPDDELLSRRLRVTLSGTSDQCWLSSWPYSGHEHAQDCRFYSFWPDARQAAIYAADVVTENSEGMLTVRLPTGLQKKEAQEKTTEETPANPADGKRRQLPSMRLAGLLHLLWEQSGINIWHPAFDKAKRSPDWVSRRLNNLAAKIRIGRLPLQDSLLLMAGKKTAQADTNNNRARDAVKLSRRLIVISQLASCTDAAEERLKKALPLGFFAGIPELLLPEDVLARLQRSYDRELRDWRSGKRVIVICECEPPETTFIRKDGKNLPNRHSTVIDVALMTVSPRFIPLDSSYEGVIEEKLWKEKRAFTKPLRYDGDEHVFPDFLLTDVHGNESLPMEVFGMKTKEYLERKQHKIAHYNAEYGQGRWWQWNAADDQKGEAIPAFPARQFQVRKKSTQD